MEINKIGVIPQVNIVANNKMSNPKAVAFTDGEDKVEIKEKREPIEKASTGKKWGVGIASLLVSGLGQFINGDNKKGFAYLGGGLGSALVSVVGKAVKVPFITAIGVIGNLVVGIASIVDAVKNAKPNKD
ncbi:MAG: hypothetical protein WCY19_00015 [Candidatus Gastranaerophilaceae bacterium]